MKKIQYFDQKNIVHARVRQAREALKISQETLAARLQLLNVNINQQGVSRIEQNQRLVTDYELSCLSKVLNVTPEWLLSDSFPPENN